MPDKKKMPSSFANMVLVLTAIGVISSLALGFTYTLTKDAIAQVQVKRTLAALNLVLPEFDNNPNAEKYVLDGHEGLVFYPAKKAGQTIGTAVETFSDNGFTERIRLMVGFDKDFKIYRISVLQQKETPGLGTKMTEAKFKKQFYEKDPASFKLSVKKDGGDVDAISAATISSRAFCDAVGRAYKALSAGGKP